MFISIGMYLQQNETKQYGETCGFYISFEKYFIIILSILYSRYNFELRQIENYICIQLSNFYNI